MPARYLYDAVGSALFEAICALPEYGVSRAGERLLARHGADLRAHLRRELGIVELGSGSGRKLRLLLEALHGVRIVECAAVDVSAAALACTRTEVAEVCGPNFLPIAAPYRRGLREALRHRAGHPVLVLFLGGNLGNYERAEAREFLQDVRASLVPGDALLLGLDLVKPPGVLRAAYDDPLGVTAAFDKNLLARMNHELGADFDLARFRHEARWSAEHRRVEMHLRSTADQRVAIPGADIEVDFRAGETIWTESSVKYELAELDELAAAGGFRLAERWVDAEWPFVHALLVAS
jgi:dimethylhistidine N-methyltransferase